MHLAGNDEKYEVVDHRIARIELSLHTRTVRRRTLMQGDAKLRRARKVLGSRSIRDTIDRAVDKVPAVDARRRLVEKLQTMRGLDLDNAEVMARAWR